MTRGFWHDRERYLETYWARFPGVWVHGDWALVDEDGHWFIHGRSDDTLKVAGKRVGPAEVEIAAVAAPGVLEAAAIGVPHEIKGEAIVVFCVLRPRRVGRPGAARGDLRARGRALGKALKPDAVRGRRRRCPRRAAARSCAAWRGPSTWAATRATSRRSRIP